MNNSYLNKHEQTLLQSIQSDEYGRDKSVQDIWTLSHPPNKKQSTCLILVDCILLLRQRWNSSHLNTPFTFFTTSWKITLKCEPSQYGAFLVCLQAHSMTALSLSGVKRRGEKLGASVL